MQTPLLDAIATAEETARRLRSELLVAHGQSTTLQPIAAVVIEDLLRPVTEVADRLRLVADLLRHA